MIRFTDLNYDIWGLEFFYCCFGCLSVFSRLMVFRTTTTQNDLGFVLFVVYLTHLFFYPWLSVIITGINWRYLPTFIHPSTVSSFPSHQWLICRVKGVIGVTLKGETGQRSPNPTRRRYAFFFPWSGLRTSYAEPEEAGYRSENNTEKTVVWLWFRADSSPLSKSS